MLQIILSSSDRSEDGIFNSDSLFLKVLLKISIPDTTNNIEKMMKGIKILKLKSLFSTSELYFTLNIVGVLGDFISHKTMILFPSLCRYVGSGIIEEISSLLMP